VQKAEKLLDMPELGARRPSDLLAAMYEYCPAGEEDTTLFRSIFLKRLPAEVRVLLVAEETAELATRADQLWLKFGQCKGDHLAAVQPKEEAQKADSSDEANVAALQVKKKSNRKKKRGGNSSGAGGQQASSSAQKQAKGKQVFLCHTHLKYGSNAYFDYFFNRKNLLECVVSMSSVLKRHRHESKYTICVLNTFSDFLPLL
jgi:hypothetical protein